MKPPLRKILHCRFGQRFTLAGLFAAAMTVFIGIHGTAAAAESSKKNFGDHKNIRIQADKLVAEVGSREIEFIGNVKLTRTDTVITANRLKIIYDPEGMNNKTRGFDIEKIIANGQVRIVYDNIIAEADKAEYTLKSAVLILAGKQSKVTQGNHSITGTKFTLYRSEGKITVESSKDHRVRAVFHPSQGVK